MLEHIFIDEEGAPPSKARAFTRVLIISALFLLVLSIAVYEYTKASQVSAYRHVTGTIVGSELTDDTESFRREAPYAVIFQAKFTYGGRVWTGTSEHVRDAHV